jgi:hypothetical protein
VAHGGWVLLNDLVKLGEHVGVRVPTDKVDHDSGMEYVFEVFSY